jgi:hypothetical protein
MSLAVISMTSDVTADVARRKMVTKITRRVLVDLLVSIAMTITVVVTTTSTTFLSTLVAAATTTTAAAATTTTWGIRWWLTVVMLATWML